MGGQLSAHEALFVKGNFDELFIATPVGDTSGQFTMSGHEWEALGSACEGASAAALRAASDKLGSCDPATLLYPVVPCLVHFLAAQEGSVPWEVARERWTEAWTQGTNRPAITPVQQQLTRHLVAFHNFEMAYQNCTHSEIGDSLLELRRLIQAVASHPVPILAFGCMRALLFIRLMNTDFPLAPVAPARALATLKSATEKLKFEVQFTKRLAVRAKVEGLRFNLRSLVKQLTSDPSACELSVRNQLPPTTLTWGTLSHRFVGQLHAISELQQYFLCRDRGLGTLNKPAVVVFFGPSGHGKTELAKIISKILHPEASDCEAEGKLMIIHMPSFCTRDSIYSMVDPPAAHVGEGILLSAVRKCANLVVVLDEFEKSTSDAVQNIWLSAFQKDGMLRSLKVASRSASTTNVTFVLTCNTCDKQMIRDTEDYLSGDVDKRTALRQTWTNCCIEELKKQFGEPFVNRVDRFLPFAPYDDSEKCQFVSHQMQGLARQQLRHHRCLLFTPSLIHHLGKGIANFHGSVVEETLRPALIEATNFEGTVGAPVVAVLHVEPMNDGEKVVILSETELQLENEGRALLELARRGEKTAASQPVQAPALDSRAAETSSVVGSTKPSKSTSRNVLQQELALKGVDSSETSVAPASLMPSLETEKQLEVELQTEREKQLVLELAVTKKKLLESEKTIECLMILVKDMEILLGILLASVMVLLLFLSLFVSLSTIFALAAVIVGAGVLLCKNFFVVLFAAMRGLYRLLGPIPFGLLVVLVSYFIWNRAQWMLQLSPPCPAVAS